MPSQIAIESPAVSNRRQPLLTSPEKSTRTPHTKGRCRGSKFGEAAGDCAAVCCLCPCAMAHLLFLAVYRVPTGIWKKKKRRRLLKKKRKMSDEVEKARGSKAAEDDDDEEETETDGGSLPENDDVCAWEKEMMERFAGFWRSDSRRNDSDS